jgi:multiple sugar transport system permease protein
MVKDGERAHSHHNRSKLKGTLLFYFLLITVMTLFMIPFIWMILNSLKGPTDVTSIPPKLIFMPTFENYKEILTNPMLPKYFRNSTFTALGSSFLGIILGLPAAYSIARFKQSRLSLLVLIARIVPMISVLLPWFIIFSRIGLRDTFIAIIVCHLTITLPMTIWVMIGFFEDIPIELEDAARVDGCSLTGAFLRVFLPLAMPGIVVSFILGFIFSWNNFQLALVISGTETRTLPVVSYMQISLYHFNWGGMAASGMILTLPALILTLFVQRHIVKGLTLGALKG